jgi:outer membrane protein insertion porin family
MRRGLEALLLALLPVAAAAQVDLTDVAAHQGQIVEAVEIEGREATREHVVTREIHTRVGEPLDRETIEEDVQRLENLQVFSEIEIEVEAGREDHVRVRFVVREMPPWIPLLALTYTEQDGFSVGPGITAFNLTGRDIEVSGKAFFGGTTQFQFYADWPWITGDHRLGARLWAAHLDRYDTLNEFQEESTEFRPRVSRFLGENGRLAGELQLFKMRSDQPGETLSATNEDLLVALGVTLGWDTRNSWTNPSGGWQNELVLKKTGGFLGGDADFWTFIADIRRWQSTFPRQRVLLSGLMSLQSGTVGVDFPKYLLYRLGGANTVRGYDVEKLGRELFGRNQMIGTVEYSYALVPKRRFDIWKFSFRLGLEVAVFGDVGVAWSEGRDLNSKRTRAGLGSGLRVLIPGAQMFRLDVGWSPEGGFRFHFAGSTKPERQRDRIR